MADDLDKAIRQIAQMFGASQALQIPLMTYLKAPSPSNRIQALLGAEF